MARLFTRAHFAELRRVFYANTGIDIGLVKTVEEFGTRIRKHADLIGELAEPPLSNRQRFDAHPTPNWLHPTPVQGRTKKRPRRDPGAAPIFKSREVTCEVVKFRTSDSGCGDELVVRVKPEHEKFMLAWIQNVRTYGAANSCHTATIDDGTQVFQMEAWPLSYLVEGRVWFRFKNCTRE